MNAATTSDRRWVRSWLTALVVILALVAPVAARSVEEPAEESSESPADEPAPTVPWVRTLEAGGGYARYTDLDDDGNGEFVRLGWSRPQQLDVKVEAGRQERFGLTTLGAGGQVTRHFPSKTSLTFGAGGSTGELSPEVSFGVSVARPLFDVIWRVGVTHQEWESGARTDKFGLGGQRWFPHWIVSAGVGYDLAEPGDTRSTSGSLGLTYYVWKKLYASVGYNFGDLEFVVVDQGGELTQSTSRGFSVGFSRWFEQSRGVNLRLDHGKPPKSFGLTLSWFQEW